MAFAGLDNRAIGIDEQNDHLVHANDVLTDVFGKFVSKQRPRLSRIVFAQPRGAIAHAEKMVMIAKVARAQHTGGAFHDRALMREVLFHQRFQSSDEKWKLDWHTIDGLKPTVGYLDMIRIYNLVTETFGPQFSIY